MTEGTRLKKEKRKNKSQPTHIPVCLPWIHQLVRYKNKKPEQVSSQHLQLSIRKVKEWVVSKKAPSMETTNLSILMFPWLANGHVFPYLELAKNLSTKNFNIFFCSTPIVLDSVTDALKNSPSTVSIHLVELRVPSSLELPPHYHTTKNLPPHLTPKLLEAFP